MMPGLDGFGLIRELRADPQAAHVPVILLSARAGEEARIEGLGTGADDYLVKPFSARELQVRVATLLGTAEIRREALHEQERAAEELREEARTLETLNRVGQTLAAELDLEKTVQAVTDAATELSGAEFGAFFYNVTNDAGEAYILYTLCGAPREAFARFGMPRNTAMFAPTFSGEGVVRVDDVTQGSALRQERAALRHAEGPPARAQLPRRPVVSRTGEVIGGLFFGHSRAGRVHRARRAAGCGDRGAGRGGDRQRAAVRARAGAWSSALQRGRPAQGRVPRHAGARAAQSARAAAQLRCSILRALAAADAARRRSHEMMERQVDHLVRLVDDLLDVSRITRGKIELRRERGRAGDVVRKRGRDQRAR